MVFTLKIWDKNWIRCLEASSQPTFSAGLEGGERVSGDRLQWELVPQSDGGREEGVEVGVYAGLKGFEAVASEAWVLGCQGAYRRRKVDFATHDFVHHGGLVLDSALLQGREV